MLAELIARYGYLIVLFGTFLEGETVLVIAGYAAHAGHLSLPWVIVCAFLGSLCGDQLVYLLGRRFAPRVLRRREAWRPKVERARALFERHAVPVMLGFRFLYGFRTVTPFTIGSAGIPPSTFLPLNALGALLWAALVSGLGYAFGHTVALAIKRAHRYEEWVILAMCVAGFMFWLVRRWRKVLFVRDGGPAGGGWGGREPEHPGAERRRATHKPASRRPTDRRKQSTRRGR